MNPIKTFEILGAITGIAGALLMATLSQPAMAFGLFAVSSVAWMAFAGLRMCWGLFAQQGLFLLSSLLGLWNSWLGPLVLG